MTNYNEKLEFVKSNIDSYPNFPKEGVLFRDIFSLLRKPEAFKALKEICIEIATSITPPIEAIAALESRGFLIGPIMALELNIPFIPLRKKGKLPGKIHSVEYDLEYGQDILEIQTDILPKGTNILVVDDLLATGGSLSAACRLLEQEEFKIQQCLVVMEIKDLGGRSKIQASVKSIVEY